MRNRREFLKTSGTFALGSLVLPGMAKSFFAMPPAGVQLFTLFTTFDQDVAGLVAENCGHRL